MDKKTLKLLQYIATGDAGYIFALLMLFDGDKEALQDFAAAKIDDMQENLDIAYNRIMQL
jgi:hypothetical protein